MTAPGPARGSTCSAGPGDAPARQGDAPAVTRRHCLLLAAAAAASPTAAQAQPAAWPLRSIPVSEPLRQLHAGGPSGLLGLGASGTLWALSATGAAATRLADGLDPHTPPASGHGRIAARQADGGLWVWQAGAGRRGPPALLAPFAGLLVLPLAVVGVAAGSHRLLRLEPGAGQAWTAVAQSAEAVLPDARPLQADLDGRGDGGHLVVLAGPDSQRYPHAVLGDGTEATRVLWLERHSLAPLRTLTVPAPHVIEDIAPRPVAWGGNTALLTVRAGPQGGQLGVVAADPAQPQALHWAALGDAIGTRNRWMAPTTDGTRLLAVHTPHIGGDLQAYRADGQRLVGRSVARGVSTHRIGARELDLAVWLGPHLLLPQQDGLALQVLDARADWAAVVSITLPDRVAQTVALPGGRRLAALLDGGRVVVVGAV